MERSTLLRLHVQYYWFIHKNAVFLSESTHSILVLWPLNFLGSEQTIVQILGRKILQKRRKFSRQNDWIVFLEWRTKRSVGCSDNDQPSARVIHTVHRVTITSINGDTSLLILSSSFLQLLSLNYSHSRHTPLLPHFIFCQGGVVWLPVSNFYNSLSDKSLFHVQIFITDCDNSSASPPHVGDSNYVLKTSPQSSATLCLSRPPASASLHSWSPDRVFCTLCQKFGFFTA